MFRRSTVLLFLKSLRNAAKSSPYSTLLDLVLHWRKVEVNPKPEIVEVLNFSSFLLEKFPGISSMPIVVVLYTVNYEQFIS